MKNARTLSKNFTDAQIERIVKLRKNGGTWPQIAKKLNNEWYANNSAKVYAGVFRRFGEKVWQKLKKSREPHPHEDFTREALGDIVKGSKVPKKRYFISAVGAAAELHEDGFKSVLSFCEKEKAELVLFPTPAHVKALHSQPNHFDIRLKPYKKHFATEYVFNENIVGLELRLNPQHIQPLTGLQRIRGRDHLSEDPNVKHLIKNNKKCSLIIAATKQMMETIPTGNDSVPRILHSTGSLTLPKHLRNRIGIIATEDHILGGLILETNGDEFYITQVQINPQDGTFVDKFGKRFYPNGDVVQERAEAFVMGDIHPGMEDQTALDVWYDVWSYIKPKRIFLHDWFDGLSISHHVEKKKVTKALRPKHFRTLEAEIEYANKVLYGVKENAPADAELILVESNHPEHLTTYLDQGRYQNDCDDNFDLGHRMVVDMLDGKDPLKLRLDPEGFFNWLGCNDDYLVEGTQCASHGHIGSNGSKGSIKQMERVHSSSMSAHRHAPGIYHDAFVVGHSSKKRHGYNNGPSEWLICSGAIYRGGHKQLVIALKTNWKI